MSLILLNEIGKSDYPAGLKCECGNKSEIAWEFHRLRLGYSRLVKKRFGIAYFCRKCAKRFALGVLRDVAEIEVGAEAANKVYYDMVIKHIVEPALKNHYEH